MSAPYSEHYAELYDLFYADKPYDQEAAFLQEQFRNHGVQPGGRILELACGTGKHAIRLAKLGYDVTATDYSAGMIACARNKDQASSVVFEQRDMQELPEPAAPFDAVICLFDSLGYVQTDPAIATTLKGVNRSLRPGGLFIVEFWHAPAMENGFDPVRVRRFQSGKDTILRISETELDRARSLAHVTYNVYELRADSTYSHINERHSNRYFTVAEMDAWARRHGFIPLASFPGFSCEGQVTDETWHVVAVWKKTAAHEIEGG